MNELTLFQMRLLQWCFINNNAETYFKEQEKNSKVMNEK